MPPRPTSIECSPSPLSAYSLPFEFWILACKVCDRTPLLNAEIRHCQFKRLNPGFAFSRELPAQFQGITAHPRFRQEEAGAQHGSLVCCGTRPARRLVAWPTAVVLRTLFGGRYSHARHVDPLCVPVLLVERAVLQKAAVAFPHHLLFGIIRHEEATRVEFSTPFLNQ